MKDDSFSVDVIKRVLSILSDQGNVKKTALAGKSGLNYAALKRYLKFLQLLRWVDFSGDPGSYVSITSIGRGFEKLLEGEVGPTTISEDVLDRILHTRPEDNTRLEERKAAKWEVKQKKSNIAQNTSCTLCRNQVKDSRIAEEINGIKYLFDKKECLIIFKRFKDVYGRDFFTLKSN